MRNLTLALLCIAAAAAISTGAHAAARVALVMGNAKYPDSPLLNPVNDANAISGTLTELGFNVIKVTDGDLRAMQRAVLEFTSNIDDDAVALFYFAGHGIQANGRNYLIPIDAAVKSESALRFEALDITDLLEELEAGKARVNLIILDACRNNPFERSFRGGRGRGLAAIDAARGTLIAYATAPGSVASDGSSGNGLYTQELLKALRLPGLKAEEVFKRVRIGVAEQSGNEQIPWESSSLTGDFVFNAAPAPRAETNVAINAAPANAGATGGINADALFWQSVHDSGDEALLKQYLEQFPSGQFRTLAVSKLETLSQSCGDLSGRWKQVSEGPCDSTFTYTRIDANTYRMATSECYGGFTGEAKVNGRQIVSKWKAALCSGTSVYELNETCDEATGNTQVTPGLVCRGEYPSKMTRVE